MNMQKIRKQHYVPRFYLQAWAPTGAIFCLRNNKIFPKKPEDIAIGHDFYRLKKLTLEDIKYIEGIIKLSHESCRERHEKILAYFHKILHLKYLAENTFNDEHESNRELDVAVNNAEELLHAGLEKASAPYVDALRNGDPSFYQCRKGVEIFLYFLCTQHFRTKGIEQKIFHGKNSEGLFPNAWNIVRNIFAYNLGFTLFMEISQYQLIILENGTEVSFLTGDQPTLNIYSSSSEDSSQRLAFYYPVSPKRAILLLDEAPSPNKPSREQLILDEVENYNQRIIKASHEMIFSENTSQLEAIKQTGIS